MRKTLLGAAVLLLVSPFLMASQCDPGAALACPPLKQYTKEFLAKAAEEYDAVEKIAPHLVQMVDDYGVTRDSIRVCLRLAARKKA